MREVAIGIITAGWLSSLLYSRYIIRTYINPVLIFASIWLVSFLLFHFRLLDYYPLEEKTYLVIVIGYIAYTVGLMLPFLFLTPYHKTGVYQYLKFPHKRFNLIISLYYLIGMFGFFLLYRDVTSSFTIQQLMDPINYQLLRRQILAQRLGGRLIQYLFLCCEIALIFSVFYAVYFKRYYLRIFLFFLSTLAYSFLSTARSEVFAYIFDFFATYIFIKYYLKNQPIKTYIFILFPLLLIFTFGGMGALLLKSFRFTRYIDTTNIFESQLYMFYYYLTNPFGALNRLLMGDIEILELGKNVFAPVLRLLEHIYPDIEVPTSRQEFTNIPYRTNVYTYIRVIYKDFGIIGVSIIPFFIGFIISSLWGRFSNYKNITFLPLVCHFTFIIVMSIFTDFFFRTTPWLILLLTFLFLKLAGVSRLNQLKKRKFSKVY